MVGFCGGPGTLKKGVGLPMGGVVKLFAVVLLLCFVERGCCKCTLNSIEMSTVNTFSGMQGNPQWRVTVTNNCQCAQAFIYLDCGGISFQSIQKVDPPILVKKGDQCLLNKGL
uniref:Uncharacterized protein n=1 Tax=Davidia involucrata TaxID=16924 RepID=A0A5B7BUD2_DAVIN